MKFTILKMWTPNSDSERLNAIDCLISFANQSVMQAENIVDATRTGIQPTEVTSIDDIKTNDMIKLGKFFQVAFYHDKPSVEPIQLKLWEVSFIRRSPRRAGSAMVLAETKERAEFVITEAIQTFGDVAASEISGPFDNGRILTTTITLK